MSHYTELVKALRYCAESGDFNCNKDCPMYPNYPKCLTKMDMDAAAAIEALQAQLPKRGEWKYIVYHNGCTPDEDIVCSVCGKSGLDNWNYCPNCGAKMEVHDGSSR